MVTKQVKRNSLTKNAPTQATKDKVPNAPASKDEPAVTVQQPGPEAQGFSLAMSAIAAVREQGETWQAFAARLMALTIEARKYFRDRIAAHVKLLNKAAKGDKTAEKAAASARTSLYSLSKFSEALDAGFEPPTEGTDSKGLPKITVPFYKLIPQSRDFLTAQAKAADDAAEAAGVKKAGRVADSFLVAVIKAASRREIRSTQDKAEQTSFMGLMEKQYPNAWKAANVVPVEGDAASGILK